MNTTIYQNIATRTAGDIYIGIVGPVRTGKSTFIKRFMESLVLPNMGDGYSRERARDEMPQSAAGKTVMTTEPKFIPDEAVTVTLDGTAAMRVKMIDCVGYVVPEALGTIENGQPRMVRTPWSEEPMPFVEAAEMGTHKVITEHATIGMLVTTDGTKVTVQLLGTVEENAPAYTTELKNQVLAIYNPNTVYQPMHYDNQQGYADGHVLQQGISGYEIAAYVHTYDSNGALVSSTLVSTDSYAKRDHIVVRIVGGSAAG